MIMHDKPISDSKKAMVKKLFNKLSWHLNYTYKMKSLQNKLVVQMFGSGY